MADRLVALLKETADLLRAHGETGWRSQIEAELAKTSPDLAGIASWFGGMGSFNDLLISPANGHTVAPHEERAVNARLSELTWAISDLVRAHRKM